MLFLPNAHLFSFKKWIQMNESPAARYCRQMLPEKAKKEETSAQALLWNTLCGFLLEDNKMMEKARKFLPLAQEEIVITAFCLEILCLSNALSQPEIKAFLSVWEGAPLPKTKTDSTALLKKACIARIGQDQATMEQISRQAFTMLSPSWYTDAEIKACAPGGFNQLMDELDDFSYLLEALEKTEAWLSLNGGLMDRIAMLLPYLRNPYAWPYEKQGCQAETIRYCLYLAGKNGVEGAQALFDQRSMELDPFESHSVRIPLLLLGDKRLKNEKLFSVISQNVRGYSHIK